MPNFHREHTIMDTLVLIKYNIYYKYHDIGHPVIIKKENLSIIFFCTFLKIHFLPFMHALYASDTKILYNNIYIT